MKASNLQAVNGQGSNWTAEEAVVNVASLYAESKRYPNGKLRQKPFFKCLATLKARMGIEPEGMIPELVYNTLKQVAHEAGDRPKIRPPEATTVEARRISRLLMISSG